MHVLALQAKATCPSLVSEPRQRQMWLGRLKVSLEPFSSTSPPPLAVRPWHIPKTTILYLPVLTVQLSTFRDNLSSYLSSR